MVLHVEAFLTGEHSLDELVKLLIFVRDKLFDVTCLGMSNDFILNNLAVGKIWEHQRQDCQRQYAGFLDEKLIGGVEADKQRDEEHLGVQVVLAEATDPSLPARTRLLEDAGCETLINRGEGRVGECWLDRLSLGFIDGLPYFGLQALESLAQGDSIDHTVDEAFEVDILLNLHRLIRVAAVVAHV